MLKRTPAASTDEIYERHGCVAVAHDPADLPDVSPLKDLMVSSGTIVPVQASLSDALQKIRGDNEVEEVYIRIDPDGVFHPLSGTHLAQVGEWVVIARRRHHQLDPRVVGIMLAKDEADVIGDVIASLRPALSALYFFPGDVRTRNAAEAASPTGWLRVFDGSAPADGARQRLLDQARADRLTDEDRRPMWVMVVQGDEIYPPGGDDDLLRHVRLAERERATVMTCQVATFLLHDGQREGWDWTKSLADRFTHYIWDFGEHSGFLDFPWVHYRPGEHMRAHPHGIYPAKYAAARPVRRHYPFRTPDQARARIEDRLKSGWQPHYENYKDIFMRDQAAGRPLKRYYGWFPEAERVEGIW